MSPYIFVVGNPNSTSLGEFFGPSKSDIAKTIIEKEELPSLLKSCPGLNQSFRCFTGFNDDSCLGKRGHGYITLREEKPVAAWTLL